MRLAMARFYPYRRPAGRQNPVRKERLLFSSPRLRILCRPSGEWFLFRADEDKAGAFNLLGKIGVLGEEAVTRMDCYCAGDFSGADDCRDVQITFTDGAGPIQTVSSASNACFDRDPHWVHSDSLDAQFFTGTKNTQCNLAAVGNNNFIQHVRLVTR